MNTKIISIVTPSFNQEKFIEQTIQSVLCQEGEFYIDYIIIDGHSTDGSVELIKKYQDLLKKNCKIIEMDGLEFYVKEIRDFPWNHCQGISYRWKSKKDNGQVDAINQGFKMAKGQVLAFLNSDDIYYPHALKTISETHWNEADFVYGQGMWVSGKEEDILLYPTFKPAKYSFLYQCTLCQPTVFFTREVFRELGNFSMEYQDVFDYEYWMRAVFHHKKFLYIKARLAKSRMYKENKSLSQRNSVSKQVTALKTQYYHPSKIKLHKGKLLVNKYRVQRKTVNRVNQLQKCLGTGIRYQFWFPQLRKNVKISRIQFIKLPGAAKIKRTLKRLYTRLKGKKERLNFICTLLLDEVVILSDGRITTCCFDADGQNTFSNIYEDDFQESIKKLQLFKEKLVENPGHFPKCSRCFISKKRNARAAYDYFLNENPSPAEIDHFLNHETAPKGLVIEAASACNLSCIGCPTGIRNLKKKGQPKEGKSLLIDIDKLKKWLTPYTKELKKIRLFNYGEPLIHPGAIDFCSWLTRENPGIDLIIATNLLPLNKKEKIIDLVMAQPNMIIVSLHGVNQESLVKYMGAQASFKRALSIMKQLIAERTRLGLTLPIVIWKYIIFNWNDSDEELEKAKYLAKKHNIDYLGFEITGGELASKRFHKSSENFETLEKSEFFIANIYKKISTMKIKRNSKFLK
jgi:glycosyltransferase involved in cell wall biosynthesis